MPNEHPHNKREDYQQQKEEKLDFPSYPKHPLTSLKKQSAKVRNHNTKKTKDNKGSRPSNCGGLPKINIVNQEPSSHNPNNKIRPHIRYKWTVVQNQVVSSPNERKPKTHFQERAGYMPNEINNRHYHCNGGKGVLPRHLFQTFHS